MSSPSKCGWLAKQHATSRSLVVRSKYSERAWSSQTSSLHRLSLDQDVVDNLTTDIRQAKVTSHVAECQLLVVDTHAMQDGRVQIVNMHWVFGHVVTKFVGLAVYDPRSNSSSR